MKCTACALDKPEAAFRYDPLRRQYRKQMPDVRGCQGYGSLRGPWQSVAIPGTKGSAERTPTSCKKASHKYLPADKRRAQAPERERARQTKKLELEKARERQRAQREQDTLDKYRALYGDEVASIADGERRHVAALWRERYRNDPSFRERELTRVAQRRAERGISWRLPWYIRLAIGGDERHRIIAEKHLGYVTPRKRLC